MNKVQILKLLKDIEAKKISPQAALEKLQIAPFEDLGFSCVDLHRSFRQAEPEVIFGERKTPEQILKIVKTMLKNDFSNILITRINSNARDFLVSANIPIEYHENARIAIVKKTEASHVGNITIVSAGTSDINVCQEAAVTAQTLGNNVVTIYDVGVAGIHRLLAKLDLLQKARVIIVVCGMEAALASVVAGLVSCPVIGVPTSVGYGASFNGLAALLSMINSCSNGVSVVNIDNGFGAAFIASMINKMESVK